MFCRWYLSVAIALAPTLASADEADAYRRAAEQWKAIAEFRQDKNEALQEWLTKCTETATQAQLVVERPVPTEIEVTPSWVWPTIALTTVGLFTAGFLVRSAN